MMPPNPFSMEISRHIRDAMCATQLSTGARRVTRKPAGAQVRCNLEREAD